MTNQNQEFGKLMTTQQQLLEFTNIVDAEYQRTKEYLGQDSAMFMFNVK